MKRSDIRCERLSKKDSLAAAKLLSLDAYTGPDLLQVLEEEPELFSAAYVDETLLALVQMEASVPQSHLNVFVAPQYRRQGIGRALMQMAEAQLQAGGTRKVSTSVRSGASSSLAFARSLGYAPYYSLIYMERTGGSFPQETSSARLYRDEDFVAAHSLYATAFHEMRMRVGCFPDSVPAEPNEGRRTAWAADAQDRLVYELDGEIAAYSHIHGNEISSVSVRSDLQGRGIGRTFVKYLCNEIHRRGYTSVTLSCVVGNEAIHLYNSLGFQETHRIEYMIKNPDNSKHSRSGPSLPASLQ
ncbi:GNAT family N-acetyltransferase [Paenibacillus sp. FSL R7-0333]|uniref:GNAT family N-acetyltransferase n=1 Tax=Paenibacillus sp. FSL R7-0333 TaxID=1926587 RepID=UPI00096F47E4|nr:GNAT family N-acetyltransferase [Paenibacillus sp. FSL R7-0333]